MTAAAVVLREATLADRGDVYAWNCARDVRALSKDPSLVSPLDHARWFERRLAERGSPMWVIEVAGIGVGVLRLDRVGGVHASEARISIALAAGARGRGIGRLAIAWACAAWARPVVAEIAVANAASRGCFESCNFVPLCERDGIVTYRWRP